MLNLIKKMLVVVVAMASSMSEAILVCCKTHLFLTSCLCKVCMACSTVFSSCRVVLGSLAMCRMYKVCKVAAVMWYMVVVVLEMLVAMCLALVARKHGSLATLDVVVTLVKALHLVHHPHWCHVR